MKITSLLILFLIVITFINLGCVEDSYIQTTMAKYTGATDYKLETRIHESWRWYLKARISESDGRKILKMHSFSLGFNSINLRGRNDFSYITEKPNYLYFEDDSAYHDYRLIILCLSPDMRHIEIYDSFGD